jgi:hypothetical protein
MLPFLKIDQREFSSLDDLVLNLTAARKLSGIIAIDGFMSSGKTILVKFLSNKLNYPYMDLDCYCNKDFGIYVQSLRMNDVRQFIDEKNANLFIAGVCILDVLDALGLSPNLCIHVKRCGPSGWYEGDYADEVDLPSQNLAKSIGMSQSNIALEMEIESYHRNRTPDLLANIVFNRYES